MERERDRDRERERGKEIREIKTARESDTISAPYILPALTPHAAPTTRRALVDG